MRYFTSRYWKSLLYKKLGKRWLIPFAFYQIDAQSSDTNPHPLRPRNFRDFTLNKMMFPDNPARAIVADKIAARGWVKERIGEDYLIPLYDICDSSLDLRLDKYPLPFVIKSNHASGHVLLIREMQDCFDIGEKTKNWLSRPFRPVLEWAYRNIDRKLIVEKMLLSENGRIPADIRVHCFFGNPIHFTYSYGDLGYRKPYHFDADWNKLEVDARAGETENIPEKPERFDEILDIARKLSVEFDYIRVDLYESQNKVYFGELTNFTLGGTRTFTPADYDEFLLNEYKRQKKEYIRKEREKYSKYAKDSVGK